LLLNLIWLRHTVCGVAARDWVKLDGEASLTALRERQAAKKIKFQLAQVVDIMPVVAVARKELSLLALLGWYMIVDVQNSRG